MCARRPQLPVPAPFPPLPLPTLAGRGGSGVSESRCLRTPQGAVPRTSSPATSSPACPLARCATVSPTAPTAGTRATAVPRPQVCAPPASGGWGGAIFRRLLQVQAGLPALALPLTRLVLVWPRTCSPGAWPVCLRGYSQPCWTKAQMLANAGPPPLCRMWGEPDGAPGKFLCSQLPSGVPSATGKLALHGEGRVASGLCD